MTLDSCINCLIAGCPEAIQGLMQSVYHLTRQWQPNVVLTSSNSGAAMTARLNIMRQNYFIFNIQFCVAHQVVHDYPALLTREVLFSTLQ